MGNSTASRYVLCNFDECKATRSILSWISRPKRLRTQDDYRTWLKKEPKGTNNAKRDSPGLQLSTPCHHWSQVYLVQLSLKCCRKWLSCSLKRTPMRMLELEIDFKTLHKHSHVLKSISNSSIRCGSAHDYPGLGSVRSRTVCPDVRPQWRERAWVNRFPE